MPWKKIFENFDTIKEQFSDKDPILLKVGEKRICLVLDGVKMYAFDNACPHNGAQLHRGHCNDKGEIVCPLHFYQFDMRSGREGMGRGYELEVYPVKIEDNILKIRFDD